MTHPISPQPQFQDGGLKERIHVDGHWEEEKKLQRVQGVKGEKAGMRMVAPVHVKGPELVFMFTEAPPVCGVTAHLSSNIRHPHPY